MFSLIRRGLHLEPGVGTPCSEFSGYSRERSCHLLSEPWERLDLLAWWLLTGRSRGLESGRPLGRADRCSRLMACPTTRGQVCWCSCNGPTPSSGLAGFEGSHLGRGRHGLCHHHHQATPPQPVAADKQAGPPRPHSVSLSCSSVESSEPEAREAGGLHVSAPCFSREVSGHRGRGSWTSWQRFLPLFFPGLGTRDLPCSPSPLGGTEAPAHPGTLLGPAAGKWGLSEVLLGLSAWWMQWALLDHPTRADTSQIPTPHRPRQTVIYHSKYQLVPSV